MPAPKTIFAIFWLLLTCGYFPAAADEAAVLAWKNAKLFDLSYIKNVTESVTGACICAGRYNGKQLKQVEKVSPWLVKLKLTDEQRAQLKLLAEEFDKRSLLASQAWSRSGDEGRKLDAEVKLLREQTTEAVLTAEQKLLIKQIFAQKMGVEIFTDPIVAAAAGLSPEQMTQLVEAQKDTERVLADVELPSYGSGDSFGLKTAKQRPTLDQKKEAARIKQQQIKGEAEYRAAEKRREERFRRIITADQLTAWKELIDPTKK